MAQTTQSKYVSAPRSTEQPEIQANEVRITTQGLVKRYVDYACSLLQPNQNQQTTTNTEEKTQQKEQKVYDFIILRATGRAINQAIKTAEVVKRRIGNLHQITNLETLEIKETWEPTEEGLKPVETVRRVASITIRLSRKATEEDKKAPGYQEPIPAEQINASALRGRGRFRGSNRGGRGRGRGFRGGRRGNFSGGGRGNFSGGGRGNFSGGGRGSFSGGGRGNFSGGFNGGFNGGGRGNFSGRRGNFSGGRRGSFSGRGRGGSRGNFGDRDDNSNTRGRGFRGGRNTGGRGRGGY